MLQNAYFLAKIGADTAENEQHFAEILPKIGNYPTGRPCSGSRAGRPRRPLRAATSGRQGLAAGNLPKNQQKIEIAKILNNMEIDL